MFKNHLFFETHGLRIGDCIDSAAYGMRSCGVLGTRASGTALRHQEFCRRDRLSYVALRVFSYVNE
jgi:hypothetical protein